MIALASAYGHLSQGKKAEDTLKLIEKSLSLLFGGKFATYPHDVRERSIVYMGYRYPPFREHEMTDLFEGGLVKAGLNEIVHYRTALDR
ncbi:MAG: hypothetical protein HKM90_04510 [Desulfobacteraceae bacterium]|nr:hypothetical protein [Desulfobacteraceae bacterium]